MEAVKIILENRHFQKRLHLGPFLKDGTSLEAEDIFIIQAH